ncbi:hypothetical protein [Kitasatospora phosalacinea]|uniref:Uncharacterized protein n=1 Tax=Kitasatospora phosalacinea TaxID=2065 RepID=A0ABW6GW85_9ACTN
MSAGLPRAVAVAVAAACAVLTVLTGAGAVAEPTGIASNSNKGALYGMPQPTGR